MAKEEAAVIRAFDGCLTDAEGLLAVERATFDESPYDARQVRDMLTAGPQRAWLAVADGRVVGFVIAFPASGLRGRWWEIDLLAVLPDWQGRGLATALVRTAARAGAAVADRARAVVADDNQPSLRAFVRAGFRIGAEPAHLLIRRFKGRPPAPEPLPGGVRQATTLGEVSRWLGNSDWLSLAAVPDSLGRPFGLRLLLAEEGGQPAGCAELIEVQTLLYRGLWVESLAAADQRARQALVRAVIAQAGGSVDEIGALVPLGDRKLQQALRSEGFRSLGVYRPLSADLQSPEREEEQRG